MLPNLRANRVISMEMIDFQTDGFGEKLEAVFAEVKKKIKAGSMGTYKLFKESEECKSIISLTADRIKMTVVIMVSPWMPAAVLPFYSNKNHVFLNEIIRGDVLKIKDQDTFLKENINGKGTVNTQTAQLGGIFSKQPVKIYLNPFFFFKDNDCSPGELTAAYLHEVGHAFYACEYSDRLSTTNQVLSDLSKTILKKKEGGDVTYIYKELSAANPKVTAADVDSMINGNKVVAGVKWFEYIVGTVQHQLSNSKYDQTSFEQLADNFAARFGYSRELVSVLDKISAETYEKSHSVLRWMYFLHSAIFALGLWYAAMGVFVLLPSFFILGVPSVLLGILFLYCATAASAEDFKDYTYDQLVERYKRIRLQLVELLKNAELSNAEIKDTVEDIYSIDASIKSTFKYNHVLNVLMNFIKPSARAAKNSIDGQRLMEELANSDLFLKAAILKAGVE